MEVKLEKKENSKVVLEFTMPKKDVEGNIDRIFKKASKDIKVPGFRAGKVPKNMVEKIYGKDFLYHSLVDDIADVEYAKAVEDKNLKVVSQPHLELKQSGEDKDLIYTVEFYVRPEIELKEYKGIKYDKVPVEVTEEEIENYINDVREKNSRLIPIEDRNLQQNDIALIDFEGFLDDVAFDGGKAEDFELTIGSGQFVPGFEEQLVGMKIDEQKDIEITFPEDYNAPNLAGKKTKFVVKLKGIQMKELPELDDEFAKDVSEFENLADYKANVTEKLKEEKAHQAKHQEEDAIIKSLLENVTEVIPESMIESKIDENMEEMANKLMSQGITLENYAKILGITIDDVRKQFKDSAQNDVKLELALEYIAKTENIEVTEEDVNTKIDELAKQYGSEDSEKLKENESIKNYLKEKIKMEKALDFVVSNAKVN